MHVSRLAPAVDHSMTGGLGRYAIIRPDGSALGAALLAFRGQLVVLGRQVLRDDVIALAKDVLPNQIGQTQQVFLHVTVDDLSMLGP